MFIFAFKREYFCPQRLVYEHDEQNPKSKIQNTEGNPAVSYCGDCARLVFGGVPLLSRAIQYGGQVVGSVPSSRVVCESSSFFPAK